MMPITDLLVRLLISFATLLVLARLMGRKEISQMTFFNFISAISIGTIGASLAIDSTLSPTTGIIALSAWTVLTILSGIIDLKSRPLRKAITGEPVVVIEGGKIKDDNLRKTRLDLETLNVLLRKKNTFSLDEVDYAVFETDGTLSVRKKAVYQPITQHALNQPPTPKQYPVPKIVVSDGNVMKENLSALDLDEQWLKEQLQTSGVASSEEVFYAEVQQDGSLTFDLKDPPQ